MERDPRAGACREVDELEGSSNIKEPDYGVRSCNEAATSLVSCVHYCTRISCN